MRSWAQPPYQALTSNVFRLFFGHLIGAVWYLVDEVNRHPRSVSEHGRAAGTGALWIAVIWIMVTAVEWMARHRERSAAGVNLDKPPLLE